MIFLSEKTNKTKFPWYFLIPAVLILAGAVFAFIYFSKNVKIGNAWQEKSLEVLSVSDISELDFDALHNLPDLKLLDLKEAGISEEEAHRIYDSLPENIEAEFYIPVGDNKYLNTEKELVISSLHEGEESRFSLFKNLKDLHFNSTALTPGILSLSEKLPGCKVSWTVSIDGISVESSAENLDLSGKEIPDLSDFLQVLTYLPSLKTLQLEGSGLQPDEIEQIRSTFPQLMVSSSVFIGDTPYPYDTEELNLSGSGLSIDALLSCLSAFPNLKTVDLHGCGYSTEDMQRLYDAYPDMDFLWTLSVYGRQLESSVESIDFSNRKIDDAFSELKEKIPFFRRLKTVDISFCGLSDEECDALNKTFPDVDIVWTVTVYGNRKFLVRTDAKAFSTALRANSTYHISTKGSKSLKYCTKMEALDIGHNNIHEIEFVENMPNLRILIVAGCGVKDISCLKNLEHLEYLELFANDIKDLSPLAGKDSLLDLNISRNKITDLTPLYSCKNLDRLWASYNPLKDGQEEAIRAQFPDTTFNFTVYSPTQGGWREHDRFVAMRNFFGLPVID